MDDINDMGLNIGGNIEQRVLQKVETVKPHIAVWNEYFVNVMFHNLQVNGVLSKDRIHGLVLSSAELADYMIDAYITREENLGR